MLLITGATGRIGRALVGHLVSAGVPVRAFVRDASSADLPAGVEVVAGELQDPSTLDDAVKGPSGAFLLWPFPSEETADALGPAVVERLSATGRVVYVSAHAAIAQPDRFWGRIERMVEDFAPAWTILQPTGFAANTLVWADQVRAGDVVRWPFGDAARSLIHERDIAEVAARALRTDDHRGRRLVLSGPAALTQREQLDAIGAALDRPLRWEELDGEAAHAQVAAAFGDEAFARQALATWASFVDRPEPVTGTVRQVLGRDAIAFADWAREHRDGFR
jgi:uncharacterized protein YbjT (DUF2867 family)